ncbi:hypothetical protein EJB05_44499, partial [Eragrostis curvula]
MLTSGASWPEGNGGRSEPEGKTATRSSSRISSLELRLGEREGHKMFVYTKLLAHSHHFICIYHCLRWLSNLFGERLPPLQDKPTSLMRPIQAFRHPRVYDMVIHSCIGHSFIPANGFISLVIVSASDLG